MLKERESHLDSPFRIWGFRMRRAVIACALFALLAGCASSPDRPGDNPCELKPRPEAGGFVVYDVLFLPVYFIYGFTCEGVRALDRHGAFDAAPKGTLEGGVYTAADGTFSVVPPPGLGIHEEYYPQQDYLLFAPRVVKGPVYGIEVVTDLEPIYASMPLDQYAAIAIKGARFQTRLAAGLPLVEVQREDITLDGRPALSIVYSQTPKGAAKPSAYYFLYFLKARHRAAVLSIAWPGDCPQCADGPEAEIRAMDPALRDFVASFILVGTGGKD